MEDAEDVETSKMEQVIRAEAADYRIRSRIEHKYDVLTQNEGEEILFQIQEKEPVSALRLKPYLQLYAEYRLCQEITGCYPWQT